MNGGFGLFLDGSEEAAKRARVMLNWDVSNGVRERACWLMVDILVEMPYLPRT